MEVAVDAAKAFFRLQSRRDGACERVACQYQRVAREYQWIAACYAAFTPHPRPLPAARFARGRRGADRRRTDSRPRARSRGTIPGPPPRLGVHPGRTAGLRKLAHAQDVALPLGDRDHAAGVKQIEGMACLDALV